jgi:hypothetical protein
LVRSNLPFAILFFLQKERFIYEVQNLPPEQSSGRCISITSLLR